MKKLQLVKVEHNVKIGDTCGRIEPNIKEDTIFYDGDEIVGFYINKIEGKLLEFVEIANNELLSKRVPKSEMQRPKMLGIDPKTGKGIVDRSCKQFSAILGSVPPKPHMRRPYPTISSVHQVKTAETFIKAMLLACREAENLIQEIAPNIYERQIKTITEKVPPKFRFGKLFTSSISNYNISAPFHRDNGNLEGCVNVIIAKKKNAKGGNTTIPDYGATVDSCNNSILVYPAWRNVHGVTPIEPTQQDGYRNSLVFYPLKAFNNYWD
jgi:hypothetical protein